MVLLDEGVDRDRVIELMYERGIETTLGTYALHAEPFFARSYGYRPGDLPGSYAAVRRSLTLPLYPPMDDSHLERICGALQWALEVSG